MVKPPNQRIVLTNLSEISSALYNLSLVCDGLLHSHYTASYQTEIILEELVAIIDDVRQLYVGQTVDEETPKYDWETTPAASPAEGMDMLHKLKPDPVGDLLNNVKDDDDVHFDSGERHDQELNRGDQ